MEGVASLKKVSLDKAALVCQDIEMSAEAQQLLLTDPHPIDYLNKLLAQQLLVDAVRFMARALPKREATWWACICARSVINEQSPPLWIKALAAAETWVFKPTEPNRRLAEQTAQAAQFDNPAAWVAMAAFWSDGSMAPEHVPPVPVTDNLNSKAVAGAVMLAAVQGAAEQAAEKYQFFIQQAIDIANGGNGQVWQAKGV